MKERRVSDDERGDSVYSMMIYSSSPFVFLLAIALIRVYKLIISQGNPINVAQRNDRRLSMMMTAARHMMHSDAAANFRNQFHLLKKV